MYNNALLWIYIYTDISRLPVVEIWNNASMIYFSLLTCTLNVRRVFIKILCRVLFSVIPMWTEDMECYLD